ncbi:MAG TPA: hypothetical protein VH482_29445 [Thermomicrobiales bacterium]|jgi:hypothetical protein
MSEPDRVTEATVRTLADLAGLPLPAERAALIAPTLAVWWGWADELNRKMREPAHWTITPIGVVTHPATNGGE